MTATSDIALRGARILIVDDEPDSRALLEIILVRVEYVVETAVDGEDALAAVVLRPPDLILLDVMLPGMTGYEVATHLKADVATQAIPILMLSGLNDRAASTSALNAGADGFLSKPIDRLDLCLRVKQLLRAKGPSDRSGSRPPPPLVA